MLELMDRTIVRCQIRRTYVFRGVPANKWLKGARATFQSNKRGKYTNKLQQINKVHYSYKPLIITLKLYRLHKSCSSQL